ncbi:hypothetical protein MA16_Dca013423 [Dendrobium catenatum]|uniref:Uncharacterized protein n=1 Tax=Dendrobium catenatum TaxID=906689 RepID=A0A2I0X2W1_9ASPA|nr:hypothetical protein MA16_Dca013423 [Dendrobium catenatum]
MVGGQTASWRMIGELKQECKKAGSGVCVSARSLRCAQTSTGIFGRNANESGQPRANSGATRRQNQESNTNVEDSQRENQESNTNVEDSQKDNEQSKTNMEDSSLDKGQSSTRRTSDQVIRAINNGGQFAAPNARFSAKGQEHNVTISLRITDRVESWVMRLIVDGVILYELRITVLSRSNWQGTNKLSIDGMTVDFSWDLDGDPMKFFFRSKIDGVGGPETYDESSEWNEGYYTLLILGIFH